MSNEDLIQIISTAFPSLSFTNEGVADLTVEVPNEILKKVAGMLKEKDELYFDYLYCVTGIDYGKELGVLYKFESTKYRHNITLKVMIGDRVNPQLESLADIWPAAYLQELEVYDLFGIRFNGSPDLYRIFLGEEWEGYPLRKDYIDNKNMIIRD